MTIVKVELGKDVGIVKSKTLQAFTVKGIHNIPMLAQSFRPFANVVAHYKRWCTAMEQFPVQRTGF